MSALRAAVDLLFPDDCAACGAPATGALSLCEVCARDLRVMPVWGPPPAPVAGAWSLGPHDGPLGAAIRRAKYRPDLALTDALAGLLGDAARGRLPTVDAVVPVPVHWRRRATRGFDQGERLARGVARALERPFDRRLRRVQGGAQAGRSGAARRARADAAFRAATGVAGRVLLVDDVCTTGATARACASELLGAGARRVYLLTLTATPRPGVRRPIPGDTDL
jgi:ComF family protein